MKHVADPVDTTREPPDGLHPEQRWSMTLAALDELDQGISVFDHRLRLVGWNRHYVELLDFPPGFAWLGRPFADFIRYNAERGEYGSGDPEVQTRERVELAARFEPHCFERPRPDGTILEIRGKRLSEGGFVTIYTDVTERKRIEAKLIENRDQLEARVAARTAELQILNRQLTDEVAERKRVAAALWESESWMRLIMDAIPARIAYVGANRRYDFANKKHEELYGIPADQFAGRHVGDVVDVIPKAQHQSYVDQALAGETVSFEYAFTNHQQQQFYLRTSYLPHHSVSGEVLGFFILGEDLTAYKKTQMDLSQAQKMEAIGQLTGGLAHDFNNLLTIVIGNLAFLEDDPALSQDARECVQTALDAVQRGTDLNRRLLAFSRRQTLQPRVIDMPRLLADVQQFLQRTLGSGIDVQSRADDATWSVRADPNELSNVLLNLAINARDAMGGSGTITIDATHHVAAEHATEHVELPPGDYVCLAIIDNGCGMPPETVEHAFEPFFTTKAPGTGTGLGLSMVYGFIKQSGGDVRIRSRPDQGTTIELYLPRAQERCPVAEPAPVPQYAAEPDGAGASILIVEDDPQVRQYIARSLAAAGFDVNQAADADAALALLRQDANVDLLLSDIVMPGERNGWALIDVVQRQYPKIRCLAMSGFAEPVPPASIPLQDRPVLLQKPFDRAKLINTVRHVLVRSAPE